MDLFGDGAGGVYITAKDAADVPGARPRHAHDGAAPSGVGLLAEVFVRLWHLTNEARWREAAENLIRAFSDAPEGLGASPLLLMSADMLERGGSVVIDGPLDDPFARDLAAAALRAPDPSLTVLAPRPASVARRRAAQRPAARLGAFGHAVSGTNLLSPSHDARGAYTADRRAQPSGVIAFPLGMVQIRACVQLRRMAAQAS